MKRMLITAWVLAAAVILSAGCSKLGIAGGFNPSENSVYIDKEGGVRWGSVEPLGEGAYTEEELRAFARERISNYNSSLGKEALAENTEGQAKLPVALVSAKIGDGKAFTVTEYDQPGRLVDFASNIGDYNVTFTSLETGRIAYFAQYFDDVEFKDDKGKAVDAAAVKADSGKVAVKAEGQGVIKTESKVLYLSGNCMLRDSNTVETSAEGTSFIILK